MIFNQAEFLCLFLPVVFGLFSVSWLRVVRVEMLLVASLIFYGVSGLEHLIVLCIGIVWTYCMTMSDRIIGSKWRLALAVTPPVLALIYYKYAAFLVRSLLMLQPDPADDSFHLFANILLPAGISFFTFELVSYSIDRYRGEIRQAPPFRAMALFISFFPHLVAGPILRFHQISDSIGNLTAFRRERRAAAEAVGYIVFGLAAKVLLADTLGNYMKPLTAQPGNLDVLTCIYVILAYSFQIYFDFYGYSLIAIGIAKLFGFQFPDNFLRPYEALNPREFWRRWHVSLSYWLRDYLYIPLGGNQAYRRNILIVFAICGLWHGAGWTFVVWGLYHAALVIGYSFVRRGWDRLPVAVQIASTFGLVSIGWTLFLFDFARAMQFGRSLLGMGPGDGPSASVEMWLALLVTAVVSYLTNFERIIQRTERTKFKALVYSAGLAILMVSVLLFLDRSEGFIYFRF